MTKDYLDEFFNFHDISRGYSSNRVLNLINYNFGVDKSNLTKENLQNVEKFKEMIKKYSKPSQFEKDLEIETKAILSGNF